MAEEERWSFWSSLKGGSEEAQSKPDRYKYDIEQAMTMRKNPRRTATSKSQELSSEDVRLGMLGLDEAEAHRDRGELQSALKLYGMSIELLLRCLRDRNVQLEGFDPETIAARLQASLSDAEAVKATLEKKKKISGSQQQPSEPSSETHGFQSLSRRLNSALEKPQKQASRRSLTRPSRQTVPQNSYSKSGIPRTAAGVRRTQPTAVSLGASEGQRHQGPTSPSEELRRAVFSDLFVNHSDLQHTTWDDIAGLENAKRSLQETAILPLMRPDLFTGLRRTQNILLYGPPGTGKTMLVRAVARESQCNLFVCTASSITSKWMGEGEKLVKALFQVGREMAPSIIFLDEMDSLLSARKSDGEHEASRRLKTEFMVQMDGIMKESNGERHVLVIACTNCPWDVDAAVLRRFPRRILIPLPDSEARKALIKHLLKKATKHNLSSWHIQKLVEKTDGFSCSDITAIASEAAFGPLRDLGGIEAVRDVRAQDVRPISYKDFDTAISQATKSVSAAHLRRYNEWQQQQAAN